MITRIASYITFRSSSLCIHQNKSSQNSLLHFWMNSFLHGKFYTTHNYNHKNSQPWFMPECAAAIANCSHYYDFYLAEICIQDSLQSVQEHSGKYKEQLCRVSSSPNWKIKDLIHINFRKSETWWFFLRGKPSVPTIMWLSYSC